MFNVQFKWSRWMSSLLAFYSAKDEEEEEESFYDISLLLFRNISTTKIAFFPIQSQNKNCVSLFGEYRKTWLLVTLIFRWLSCQVCIYCYYFHFIYFDAKRKKKWKINIQTCDWNHLVASEWEQENERQCLRVPSTKNEK